VQSRTLRALELQREDARWRAVFADAAPPAARGAALKDAPPPSQPGAAGEGEAPHSALFDAVVLTAPVPQILALPGDVGAALGRAGLADALARVR
jgi:hypothetical protein